MPHANENMKMKLHQHFLQKTIEIDSKKRAFTENEMKDIDDFKEIMRGQFKVGKAEQRKIKKACKAIESI